MGWNAAGEPTHNGCPFIPYLELSDHNKRIARQRFSPDGRQGHWREIESWAWAVRKDGELAKCRYIEPIY